MIKRLTLIVIAFALLSAPAQARWVFVGHYEWRERQAPGVKVTDAMNHRFYLWLMAQPVRR